MKTVKILSVLLALLTLLSVISVVNTFAAECEDYYLDVYELYGDTDGDSKITVKDATAVQKHLAKLITLERKEMMSADVDANGKVSVSDATDIQKYLANIIPCFEADPAHRYKPGDKDLNLSYEYDGIEKILVDITEDGFYKFNFKTKSDGFGYLEVYDDRMNYLSGVDTDFQSDTGTLYLTRGRYICIARAEYVIDEADVYRFSVTESEAPFDVESAQLIKAGESVKVSSNATNKIFKIEYDPEVYGGKAVYLMAQGENPKVSLEVYDSHLSWRGLYEPDSKGDTKSLLYFTDYYSGKVKNTEYYVVVKQEEGGSDFTLTCKTYLDYILENCTEVKLDEVFTTKAEEFTYGEDFSYFEAQLMVKFTPQKDGYYKLNIKSEDVNYISGTSAGSFYPDVIMTNWLRNKGNEATAITELKAGKTYAYWCYIDTNSATDVTFNITESSKDEFEIWFEEASNPENLGPEYDGTSWRDECIPLELGKETYVSLLPMEETEDFLNDEQYFKFTADEDMTVVVYSLGSEDAVIEIEDEEEYRGTYDNCGRLSSDFATVCNMKKGETCYFRVSSYEYYGDAFYLGVKDINDYQSII